MNRREVVQVFTRSDGYARVEIFRRDDGTFGFEELRYLHEEKAWVPWGRRSESFVDVVGSAVREATGRVDWLGEELGRPG